MEQRWTREEIEDRLGRPLTRWDQCPWCGRTPPDHVQDSMSGDLLCRGEGLNERTKEKFFEELGSLEDERRRSAALEREVRELRAKEMKLTRRLRRDREAQSDRPKGDRSRVQGSGSKGKIINPSPTRGYFDSEV